MLRLAGKTPRSNKHFLRRLNGLRDTVGSQTPSQLKLRTPSPLKGGRRETQRHRQPEGSQPWPAHPQVTARNASPQHPLQRRRHCVRIRDHLKRLLHSAGLRPFSSPHRVLTHLFSYANKRWDFFLYNHKEGGDAHRQLNVHRACLPGTCVLHCCKKDGLSQAAETLPLPFLRGAGGHVAPGQGERQGPMHAHHALLPNAAWASPWLRTLCPQEKCPQARLMGGKPSAQQLLAWHHRPSGELLTAKGAPRER